MDSTSGFIQKLFSVTKQRRDILDNERLNINNFLDFLGSSPGKKILCQASIDYYRDLYENNLESSETVKFSRYNAVKDAVNSKEIKQYSKITVIPEDIKLENNNWYFLPVDKKVGEKFMLNKWSQEDHIYTSAPEIPHLIFGYAAHTTKILSKNEILLFENVSAVSTPDLELHTEKDLSTDPNVKWRKKISRNDSQNNRFNLLTTYFIRLTKNRPYNKDEFQFQFFKVYISFLLAKKKGANSIHVGGKLFQEYLGKRRTFIYLLFFAASLVGIEDLFLYIPDGSMDRADEAIITYSEYPFNRIITSLSSDCYSTAILHPDPNAVWEWFLEKENKWVKFTPYLSAEIEKKCIKDHTVEFELENGKHYIDFNNNTDFVQKRGLILKIRRVVLATN